MQAHKIIGTVSTVSVCNIHMNHTKYPVGSNKSKQQRDGSF